MNTRFARSARFPSSVRSCLSLSLSLSPSVALGKDRNHARTTKEITSEGLALYPRRNPSARYDRLRISGSRSPRCLRRLHGYARARNRYSPRSLSGDGLVGRDGGRGEQRDLLDGSWHGRLQGRLLHVHRDDEVEDAGRSPDRLLSLLRGKHVLRADRGGYRAAGVNGALFLADVQRRCCTPTPQQGSHPAT